MDNLKITKNEIETFGTFKKSVYGICKTFEWKQYKYKNKCFNVSQFSNEVEEIKKIYCEVCGKSYFSPFIKIIFGAYTCRYCAKAING